MDNTKQRLWQYFTGISGLKRNDVWLACYPKAGSTWLRFIVCNLISMAEMNDREVDFPLVAELSPSLGRSNLHAYTPYQSMPRIIKTHQPYRSVIFSAPKRTIYILRDPRDVMVSRFHYRQASVKNAYTGTFAEFIRHPKFGLDTYFEHYWSWYPHITAYIQYEKMKQNPLSETMQMFKALDIQVTSDHLQEAIERSTMDKMRKIQAKTGLAHPGVLDPNYMFARKGKSKQWIDYFSAEDLAYDKSLRQKHNYTLYPTDA